MAEYFDISLLIEDSESVKDELNNLLYKTLGLTENPEDNKLPAFFPNKRIVLSYFPSEEADYHEISIGLSDQKFQKSNFENQIALFTKFMDFCFKNCKGIKLGLCSFELNGYLLSKVLQIEDIDEDLLKKFPIVYKNSPNEPAAPIVNLDAQDIGSTTKSVKSSTKSN